MDNGINKEEEKQSSHIPIPTASNCWSDLVNGMYSLKSLSLHKHRVTDCAISTDESLLFSTSHDGTLSVYSLTDRKLLKTKKISHLALSCCSVTSVQTKCAVGSWDNNIYIYDNKANGAGICQMLKGHTDAISCLEHGSCGLISAGWDALINIWDIQNSSKPLISFAVDSEVRSISSSQTNIVVGTEEGNIYLFDTRASRKYILMWDNAHNDEVNSIAFMPDTFEFVSCSSDCSMKHWNATNGKLVQQMAVRENLNCIRTDGEMIIAGGESGIIRLFKVKQMEETAMRSIKLFAAHSISSIAVSQPSRIICAATKEYANNVNIFESRQVIKRTNPRPRLHTKSKSLPSNHAHLPPQLKDNQSSKQNICVWIQCICKTHAICVEFIFFCVK